MSFDKHLDALKKVLADSYVLYLKTQNYHWHVTGPQFKQLHELFEAQYNDLFAAIDDIAERIRTLGDKAPATFTEFSKLTSIKEGNSSVKSADMVKELTKDQDKIIKTLHAALDTSQDVNDDVTVDLMIGRIAVHEKNRWMLSSSV